MIVKGNNIHSNAIAHTMPQGYTPLEMRSADMSDRPHDRGAGPDTRARAESVRPGDRRTVRLRGRLQCPDSSASLHHTDTLSTARVSLSHSGLGDTSESERKV